MKPPPRSCLITSSALPLQRPKKKTTSFHLLVTKHGQLYKFQEMVAEAVYLEDHPRTDVSG